MLDSVKTRLSFSTRPPEATANGPVFRSTRSKSSPGPSIDIADQKSKITKTAKKSEVQPEFGLYGTVRAMRAHCQEHGIR